MLKNRKMTVLILINLVIILSLTFFSSKITAEEDSLSEIQKNLLQVSDEEKKILEILFTLTQEINEMEKEEDRVNKEIESITHEIEKLEKTIADEEITYKKNKDVLKQVLKSYQRMGPGSYLEIILNSQNLTTFLRRINTLRDITRNTGVLLETLDKSKVTLALQKNKLSEKLLLVKEKENELLVSIDNKLQLKSDMENYLESLAEQREHYQEQLDNIEKVWDQLKPLFSDTAKAFSNIVEEGNFPQDAIEINFSLFKITGSLKEETFKDIIGKHPLLKDMEIEFERDKMTFDLPKQNLVLSGNLVVVEGSILKFEATEGTFFGLPLERVSIEELFEENQLVLDIESLLAGEKLNSVEINEDSIELIIIPNLL